MVYRLMAGDFLTCNMYHVQQEVFQADKEKINMIALPFCFISFVQDITKVIQNIM